ncbi:MAG: hypothetical protein IT379_23855 [Deltaproteobacteria bacterium]|nr:hypothetical protein [Deltaproteobacteria bacterium]
MEAAPNDGLMGYHRAVLRNALVVAAALLAVATVSVSGTRTAVAQPQRSEEPDVTRLDVERLPPEVVPVSRDLFARGFFFEASLGAVGFSGGLQGLASVGPWLSVGFGLELFRFFAIRLAVETSVHAFVGPPPPDTGFIELFGATAQARLQIPLGARFAVWIAGEGGAVTALPDLLETYGLEDSTSITPQIGGQMGFDFHHLHRHLSIGVQGGGRLMPGFEDLQGRTTIAVMGGLYMRYVL